MSHPTREAKACARAWFHTMDSCNIHDHVIRIFGCDFANALITSIFNTTLQEEIPFAIQGYVSKDQSVISIGDSYLTVENIVKLSTIYKTIYGAFRLIKMLFENLHDDQDLLVSTASR